MAKARPKPRILFVCSQNSDGHVDPGALEVLKQLVQLLSPLQEQGHIDLWVEEPDSRIYLEDVLSQRPSRQFLTILHVIGPLVDGQIKVRGRGGSGLVSPQDDIWTREEWPFLRSVIFSGGESMEWQTTLVEFGIPMVLNTGANLESSIEVYLHLMAGNPILESAMSFVDVESAIFAYKGDGNAGRWTTSEPTIQDRSLTYLENKSRALSWRLRNPLLIPSSEKQWLTQQIQRTHESLLSESLKESRKEIGSNTAEEKEGKIEVAPASKNVTTEERETKEIQTIPEKEVLETDQSHNDSAETVIEEPNASEVAMESVAEEATVLEKVLPDDDQKLPIASILEKETEQQTIEESDKEEIEITSEEEQPAETNPDHTSSQPVEEEEELLEIPEEQASTLENEDSGETIISAEEEIYTDDSEETVEKENEEPVEAVDLEDVEGVKETEKQSYHQIAPLFPTSSGNSEDEKEDKSPATVAKLPESEEKEISIKGEKHSLLPQSETAVETTESEVVAAAVVEPLTSAEQVKKPKPAKRPGSKKPRNKNASKNSAGKGQDLTTVAKEELSGAEKIPKPAKREKIVRKVKVSQEEKPVKPKEPSPNSQKRNWIIWGGITLITGLIGISLILPGVLSGLGFGSIGIDNPCPFPTEDDNYHVLVLSFIEEGECKPSEMVHEKVLLSQLKALRQEGVHVDVRLLEVEDCENRTGKAKGIAQTCGADLIIWGKYNGKAQSNSTGLLHYYVADEKYSSILFSTQTYQEQVRFQPDLIMGDLPNLFVTNLLYWYEALYQKEEGHPQEVVRYLEAMEPLEGQVETIRIQFLRNAYLIVGLFGKAKHMYDGLIAADPNISSFYLDRAEILKRMGLYESAIEDYNKALELEPGDLESLVGRGMIYTEKGDYNEAIRDFSQLIRDNQSMALGYLHRANAYAQNNSTVNATRDYSKAINLNPDYAEAYYGRAKLKLNAGQRASAREDISEALRINPEMEEAILFETEAQLAAGEYDVALNSLNQLLESRPSAKIWFTKARLLEEVRELERAETTYTEAISLSPAYFEAIMNRGKVRFALGKMEPAKKDFLSVISLRPTNTEAMAWLGRSMASLNNSDSAKIWFEKAFETDPQLAEPLIYLAEMKYGEGLYEEALEDINQLVIRGTRRADVFLLRGKIHAGRGAVFPAMNDFNRAIQLDRTLSQAYVERAKVRIKLKNNRGATEDLDEAIRYKTKDAVAYLMRAEEYIKDNNFESVPSMFAEAIKLDSNLTTVNEARGAFLQRLNRHDQAISDFNHVISTNPAASPQVYLMRGNSLAAKGLNNEAMLDYNRVLRMWPDSASVYCARGMLYQAMGQLNQAQEDFERALEIDPQNALTFYSQGLLYQEMKNFERALELFDEAIALDPQYAEAYNRRGEVFVEMESLDRALADFSTALSLDPSLGRAYRNRGNLEREVSEYESAIRDYSQAVTFDPSDAESYYNRGFLYAIQERYDMAVPDIRKSLELEPNDGLRYGFLAKIYARQGKEELFYQNIEIALSKNYPMIELDHDPAFNDYRNEDRFQNLLKRYQR